MRGNAPALSNKIAKRALEHRVNERGSIEHTVKSWPKFFELIRTGKKTHDLRRADDRDFRIGDTLRLQEFDPKTNMYTGREIIAKITYITSAEDPCALSDAALHPDFCILSINRI